MDWATWLIWFIKAFVVSMALLGGFAYLTWYERALAHPDHRPTGRAFRPPAAIAVPSVDLQGRADPSKAYARLLSGAHHNNGPSIVIAVILGSARPPIVLFGRTTRCNR
jgi:hypothetical protein